MMTGSDISENESPVWSSRIGVFLQSLYFFCLIDLKYTKCEHAVMVNTVYGTGYFSRRTSETHNSVKQAVSSPFSGKNYSSEEL